MGAREAGPKLPPLMAMAASRNPNQVRLHITFNQAHLFCFVFFYIVVPRADMYDICMCKFDALKLGLVLVLLLCI